MTDRPIIFSAPMVQALLAGRKTQTRRVLKGADDLACFGWTRAAGARWENHDGTKGRLPCWVGDRLWVREAHRFDAYIPQTAIYRADFQHLSEDDLRAVRWRPSIHMPRWASRLTLHVTDVRVQRLQDISRDDAIAEGLALASNAIEEFWRWPPPHDAGLWLSPIAAYRSLWNSLHGADAWDANPWVAAISFTVEHANIDSARAA